MATVEELAALRLIVAEPDDVEPYTNVALGERIDAATDLRVVASEIWTEKAARYAELVDVQEGSSRRSLGDLHEQALAMSERLAGTVATEALRRRQSRTRAIERP